MVEAVEGAGAGVDEAGGGGEVEGGGGEDEGGGGNGSGDAGRCGAAAKAFDAVAFKGLDAVATGESRLEVDGRGDATPLTGGEPTIAMLGRGGGVGGRGREGLARSGGFAPGVGGSGGLLTAADGAGATALHHASSQATQVRAASSSVSSFRPSCLASLAQASSFPQPWLASKHSAAWHLRFGCCCRRGSHFLQTPARVREQKCRDLTGRRVDEGSRFGLARVIDLAPHMRIACSCTHFSNC